MIYIKRGSSTRYKGLVNKYIRIYIRIKKIKKILDKYE